MLAALLTPTSMAALKAHFPMDIENGLIRNTVAGATFPIEGRFLPMQINGVDGKAWRTDGYSSRITARIGDIIEGTTMTASLTMAIDTYPIIVHETPTEEQIAVASCLDHGKKSGFGFFLGRTGKYSFRMYAGGQLVTVNASGILPLWSWIQLSAVIDNGSARLFCNGSEVGNTTFQGNVSVCDAPFFIGRADDNRNELGGAPLAAFNGAIDDISVYDSAIIPTETTREYADLNLPPERYSSDIMRTSYHGAPGMNWTNESHGLIYWNEAYHLFFQKTGSAPVMTHQHWGHLVSEDLLTWRDEKPALAPGADYDIKGCWSGCVFQDREITGLLPGILYTGVNYAEPFVAYASTADENLREWTKNPANPIVKVSDTPDREHFRDTYFFRHESGAYFITGTSRNGKAATLLHRYAGDGRWEPQGYFYESSDAGVDGAFAEMPNVTRIGNKWVMTTTPLGGSRGVVCLYRTGTIDNEGRFIPDGRFSNPEPVDILARKGFGLMSPSPCVTPDGKVIAMGIVADKLPTHYNIEHGYAHLYSLPREWSLDNDGCLLQRPYEGVYKRRNLSEGNRITLTETELNGSLSLHPVRGREAEVCATFVVGDSQFGFNFYKTADGRAASVSYNPVSRELAVDFQSVSRYDQDEGNPGRFSSVLQVAPARGEEMKIHLFIDHSIIDLFVNDRYASSVRLFPTDENADLIEVFSDGPTHLKSLEGYIMGKGAVAPDPVVPVVPEIPESTGKVAMYIGYPSVEDLSANSQEKKAYEYFISAFPNGKVYFSGEPALPGLSQYDCLWVNTDRNGLEEGWENLPESFCNPTFISALKNYLSKGGNLYLTKFATQLAIAVGRTSCRTTEFNSGEGGIGYDVWQVNISANGIDYSSHPAFHSLPVSDNGYGKLIDLLGNQNGLHREDHNCMWRMNDFGGHSVFCRDNNARVLGTWGHDGGQHFAGIVEFLPVIEDTRRAISAEIINKRRGTIIANGLAAYEWAPRTDGQAAGINSYHTNIETLSTNILSYLSPESMTATGVFYPESQTGISVTPCAGGLAYAGIPDGSFLEIYTTDGSLVERLSTDADGFIPVPCTGVVIVAVHTPEGPCTFRILMR